MKKYLLFLLIAASCAMGCQQDKKKTTIEPTKKTVTETELTRVDGLPYLQSFGIYWNYKQTHIRLYEDFTAVDTNLAPIPKDAFYKKLATGKFIALRVPTEKNYYQLFAVPDSVNSDFKYNISYFANRDYVHFKMENKPVPKFHFTDVKGNVYTPENTAGKIVVIKCWFISCAPCRAEMPALNQLVDRYADRKDVIFISLAIDDKQPLISFLKTTEFKYQVVPNQEDYMQNKLHVFGYPTHIVVNKKGMVTKIVNDSAELAYILDAVDKGDKI